MACPQQPAAWSYELATYRHPACGTYSGWKHCLSVGRPNVPEGSIRNLVPLYAASVSEPTSEASGTHD